MSVRAAVVLPAAGAGRRFGGAHKPFLELAGEPILKRALNAFFGDPRVVLAAVALPASVFAEPPAWLAGDPRVRLAPGGAERGASVRNALALVPADIDVVLVHDAARPLVTADLIDRAISAAAQGASVIAAVPASDTIQRVDRERRIVETPDRSALWLAQTPQAFPRAVLVAAYERAREDRAHATDDAAVVRRAGGAVSVIEGDTENIKITRPADLIIAEAILLARPA